MENKSNSEELKNRAVFHLKSQRGFQTVIMGEKFNIQPGDEIGLILTSTKGNHSVGSVKAKDKTIKFQTTLSGFISLVSELIILTSKTI